jgi:hypothetical protein
LCAIGRNRQAQFDGIAWSGGECCPADPILRPLVELFL